MLERKLAIKEFFLKDYFNRDETTAHVTCSTASNREMAAKYRKKFIKEAQTLLKISHPYLVEVLDIFEENDTAYYVMEYVEGTTLLDLVKQRGPLPEAEAIDYVLKVAEVLAFIHGKKVTHLDVKPSNILLNQSTKEVKLIDFGASKHYDAQTGTQTTIATPCYSPGFAPIEQYKQGGVSTFSPQSDIYALGATLYKLVTGTTPAEPSELISTGITEFPATLSATTKGTIRMAMKLNKSQRPQTMEEFIDYLTGKKQIPAAEGQGEATIVIDETNPETERLKKQLAQAENLIKATATRCDTLQTQVNTLTAAKQQLESTLAAAQSNNGGKGKGWVCFWATLIISAVILLFTVLELQSEQDKRSELYRKNEQLTKQNNILEDFAASGLVVTDVDIKNDGDNYNETIYSRNTTYINPQITVSSLVSGDKDIYIKFITPSGLSRGDESPQGYSYKRAISVSEYESNVYELDGWGGATKGHWPAGNYRFEFYYDGKLIGQKPFTIH